MLFPWPKGQGLIEAMPSHMKKSDRSAFLGRKARASLKHDRYEYRIRTAGDFPWPKGQGLIEATCMPGPFRRSLAFLGRKARASLKLIGARELHCRQRTFL